MIQERYHLEQEKGERQRNRLTNTTGIIRHITKGMLQDNMTIDLRLGDCLEVLKTIPDNSIDSVVTDPPYHLTSIVERFGKPGSAPVNNQDEKEGRNGPYHRASKGFMGKEWDGGDIAFRTDVWEQCLRILKPGGHLLAFSHSRTYHRMGVAIEDAGFEIRDQIMWVYGSGFPKSHNIGKAIDKIEGNESKIKGFIPRYPEGTRGEKKTGDSSWFGGNGFEEQPGMKPVFEINNDWEGWGTALKPAHEPIVMARKPLSEKSIAENVLKHGTGGINIDGSRIEFEDTKNAATNPKFRAQNNYKMPEPGQESNGAVKFTSSKNEYDTSGRFPANIIFDEEAGQLLDEQAPLTGSAFKAKRKKDVEGGSGASLMRAHKEGEDNGYRDERGGASRFFLNIKNENEIWETKQLNVNTALLSSYQQEVVEDIVVKLVAIRDNQEDKQLKSMIQPFMNEMVIVLKNNNETNIRQMLNIGEKFLQEASHIITEKLSHNPVKFVELQKLINITTIIQNLLNIDGFVENITSNIILNNMVLGEQDYPTKFKYCPKAAKSDRNEGLDHFEDRPSQLNSGGVGRKTSVEKRLETNGENAPTMKNNHPTVKPTDLMRYLINLITPSNGTILDPFMGSGSTGKAAVRCGVNFIGIEKEQEYMDIASARIEHEKNKPVQTKLFNGKE